MRKLMFLLVGTVVLCVPAVSIAGTPTSPQLATKMCKQIRAGAGKQTFRQTYQSFAGCLKAQKSDAKADLTSAAKTCKAQRGEDPAQFASDHDGKSFNQFYGTNGGKGKGAGANAYGKCVSTLAKQNAKSDASDSVAAAKDCKTMRSSDLATFQATYGKGRNAFGKCVAKQSNAKNS